MTDFCDIRYVLAEGVGHIALHRPDRLNAITTRMLEEVMLAIDAALRDGARVLLLTGEGRAFCAGLDLHDAAERNRSGVASRLIDTHFNPLARKLADCPIPIITALQGASIGAGLGFALAGDIILAARSAYLTCAFVHIGAVPDTGVTWLLARAVGRIRAMEMIMLGERVSAQQALESGLITRICDDETLLDQARAIARRLASGPSVALGLVRRQVASALAASFEDTLEIESCNQATAKASHDFLEGVAAFTEKRAPRYRGC